MSYNAVLRKENAEGFGRLSLSTLETLPKACEVMDKEKFIPKTTITKTHLCYNKFPSSVYTEPLEREITVRTTKLVVGLPKTLTFSVSKDTTVKTLKRLIREQCTDEKLRFTKQILYHDEEQLEDFQTVESFVFQRQCTFDMESDFVFTDVELFRLTWRDTTRVKKRSTKQYDTSVIGEWQRGNGGGGGGGPSRRPRNYRGVSAVDLKAEQVEGKGVPVRNDWEGYSYGLTIIGTCLRKSCPSHKIPLKQTSRRAGYGIVRIDMNRQTFHCPACAWQFLPENFVVCNARAFFRFKKTGSHLEVETSLLQSFGGINEYARFNDEGEDAEYDWIEVKTVKKDQSVHICSHCDIPIRLRREAVLFDCGHPVHRKCMGDECGVCNAPSFSETEVKDLANRATGKTVVTKAGPSGTCRKRKRQ